MVCKHMQYIIQETTYQQLDAIMHAELIHLL